MKKLILMLIAFFFIGGIATANNSEYTLEGPNHADFLQLVNDRHSYLRESLFHIPTNMYRGPETLATMKIAYQDYLKFGVIRSQYLHLFNPLYVGKEEAKK